MDTGTPPSGRQWTHAQEEVESNYLAASERLASDPAAFEHFRRDPDYAVILEGGSREVGDGNLKRLHQLGQAPWLLEHLAAFSENDRVGNPVVWEFSGLGRPVSSSVIQYAVNAADTQSMYSNSEPKSIVEIGGGYGGLCRILSVLFEFDTYTMIDQPEALALAKSYLDRYPDVGGRVRYISCYDDAEISRLENIDLALACSSMAELGYDAQVSYNNHVLLKSNKAYLVYNTLHIAEARRTFRHLYGTWTRDADVRIENPWDQILHVYIQREPSHHRSIADRWIREYNSPVQASRRFVMHGLLTVAHRTGVHRLRHKDQ